MGMFEARRGRVAAVAGVLAIAAGILATMAFAGTEKETFDVPDAGTVSGPITCPKGKTALDPGFSSSFVNPAAPGGGLALLRKSDRKWSFKKDNAPFGPGEIEVTLNCESKKPKIKVKTKSFAIDESVSFVRALDAECPKGMTAVSGGFDVGNPGHFLHASFPENRRTWRIYVADDSGTPATAKVQAICAKIKGKVRSHRVTRTITGGGGSTGTARSECKADEKLLTGGFKTDPLPGEDEIVNSSVISSQKSGSRGWKVTAAALSGEPRVVAYAICTPK